MHQLSKVYEFRRMTDIPLLIQYIINQVYSSTTIQQMQIDIMNTLMLIAEIQNYRLVRDEHIKILAINIALAPHNNHISQQALYN